MIGIEGLHHLASALSQIDLLATQQAALDAEARRLAGSARDALSYLPGSDHTAPWLRTGALRESMASEAGAEEAVIGSADPVAVFQELGTHAVPPRPFLAPVAAARGGEIARNLAQAVTTAIREVLR